MYSSFFITYVRPLHRSFSDDAGEYKIDYPLRFSVGIEAEQFPDFTGTAQERNVDSSRISPFDFLGPGESMKICLVTAFPPSRRGLNEYGFHMARELRRDPLLSLTILADELGWPGGRVARLRRHALLALRLAVESGAPVEGDSRHQAGCGLVQPAVFDLRQQAGRRHFSGLGQPVLSRLSGHYTHVTLHHLMDNINLADSGVRFPRLYRAAGSLATRMLLMANSISVLLPVYRRTLDRQVSRRQRAFSRPRHSGRLS